MKSEFSKHVFEARFVFVENFNFYVCSKIFFVKKKSKKINCSSKKPKNKLFYSPMRDKLWNLREFEN